MKIKEYKTRLEKLKKIQKLKVDPYPASSHRSHPLKEVVLKFDNFASSKIKITLVGRIRSIRIHGGSCFSHIEDGTEKMQIYLKRNVLNKKNYQFFLDLIDIGDFIQVTGKLFKTKKGEKTLLVENYTLLAKALLPLPEKWHGLSDIEIRYRKRYLDLISNPQVRGIFEKRVKIIKVVREFFDQRGFLEVETPILQPIYGGAAAKPFVTHHQALNMDLYLRIAPELYLKRLIIGGLEKVYEIARCFRNEGIDREHNPEFTQIEFYQAYADYEELMKLTEELLVKILEEINDNLVLKYEGKKLDFAPPFKRIIFREAIKSFAELDLENYPDVKNLFREAATRGLKMEKNWSRGKIIEELYKELVRPKLIKPTFLIDYPVELSPLAKRKKEDPKYVERFQLVVAGIEIVNAFSELNDPIDQKKRFLEQQKLLKKGEEEAHPQDLDFIEALEHGMPPTAGFGMGIDRLTALLCNCHNIKEVILFPTLRPK